MTGKQEGLADAVARDADAVGSRRAGRPPRNSTPGCSTGDSPVRKRATPATVYSTWMTPPTLSFPCNAFARIFKSSKGIAHASEVKLWIWRAARVPTAMDGRRVRCIWRIFRSSVVNDGEVIF